MKIDPGKLRHRVELQEYSISSDAIGNQIQSWKTAQTAWAAVNSLYGQEYWAAAAQGQQNTLVFVLRYSPLLGRLMQDADLTRWRLLFEGRPYSIKSCDDVDFQHILIKIKAVRA